MFDIKIPPKNDEEKDIFLENLNDYDGKHHNLYFLPKHKDHEIVERLLEKYKHINNIITFHLEDVDMKIFKLYLDYNIPLCYRPIVLSLNFFIESLCYIIYRWIGIDTLNFNVQSNFCSSNERHSFNDTTFLYEMFDKYSINDNNKLMIMNIIMCSCHVTLEVFEEFHKFGKMDMKFSGKDRHMDKFIYPFIVQNNIEIIEAMIDKGYRLINEDLDILIYYRKHRYSNQENEDNKFIVEDVIKLFFERGIIDNNNCVEMLMLIYDEEDIINFYNCFKNRFSNMNHQRYGNLCSKFIYNKYDKAMKLFNDEGFCITQDEHNNILQSLERDENKEELIDKLNQCKLKEEMRNEIYDKFFDINLNCRRYRKLKKKININVLKKRYIELLIFHRNNCKLVNRLKYNLTSRNYREEQSVILNYDMCLKAFKKHYRMFLMYINSETLGKWIHDLEKVKYICKKQMNMLYGYKSLLPKFTEDVLNYFLNGDDVPDLVIHAMLINYRDEPDIFLKVVKLSLKLNRNIKNYKYYTKEDQIYFKDHFLLLDNIHEDVKDFVEFVI